LKSFLALFVNNVLKIEKIGVILQLNKEDVPNGVLFLVTFE